MRAVGRNAARREGPEKLCGLTRYVDDYALPGCLHGVTLRASIPHGLIRGLTFDPAFPWDEFVVATARDIPGRNRVALIVDDQPLLAETEVRHATEPIALVAHASRDRAYEALRHITVAYEPGDPVLTLDEALRRIPDIHGAGAGSGAKDDHDRKDAADADARVFKRILIERGNVEDGLQAADLVVEGEYRVPHQEHAYIENNGVAAYVDADGTIVVMGSLQCPFYVHKALKGLFDLPDERVRIIQTATGGGFGGKEEYPNMIAGHAALLARKAGRPVKMIYDRHEDMLATTKRHPALVRHRTGVMRDGTLVAQDIEVFMDGGAYITLSPVVLSRGALHATGPYTCPNVRIRAAAVATHTPPNGAFRGFGAPQTLFAAELHMERIAAALGLDAVKLRMRNIVRRDAVLATGQVLRESIGATEVLQACVTRSGYAAKVREYARWNRVRANPTWKGIGLALVHHGAGFTGRGEVMLASRAAVSLSRDGRLTALAASTEIGQGTTTMFAQITADALGVPLEWVDVQTPDTWKVPNSGPTVASRTCMVVGGLLQRAAARLRQRIVDTAGAMPATRPALADLAPRVCGDEETLRIEEEYRHPPEIVWDEERYRGDAYGVYSYAAAVVDLEIDRRTFEVAVRRVTTAQDIGKAINPLLVEGQIIGGMVQGLGYALLEHVVYRNGVMQNAQLTNYIIPTSLDVPPFDVILVEEPYSHGPSGAKGIGELPMDVPAPAVAAAILRATGLVMSELPILPEKLCAAHAASAAARTAVPAVPGVPAVPAVPAVARAAASRTASRLASRAVSSGSASSRSASGAISGTVSGAARRGGGR